MESEHIFKVYYDKRYVCEMLAHTKWEAVEKAFRKFSFDHPDLQKNQFSARIKK